MLQSLLQLRNKTDGDRLRGRRPQRNDRPPSDCAALRSAAVAASTYLFRFAGHGWTATTNLMELER